MPHPFDEYTIKQAQEIIQNRADKQAEVNRAFYSGDHWGPNGEFWIGPLPEAHQAIRETIREGVQKLFTARNVIGEIVTRHVTAVAGKQVHWKFTVDRELGTLEVIDETGQTITEDEQPTEQENALISEAEAVLVTWFDRMEAQELFQQLVTGALLGKRGVLRLYVPPGVRDDNGNVPAGDLSEQLDRIWLQCLNLNEDTLEQQAPSATIYVDKRTRREVGIFAYTDEDESDEERAEIVYVDDDGNTVLRIVNAAGDVEEPVIMDLGGRLTMYEMTRQALVSPQMILQQKALNLAETMRASNDVIAGFVERVIFNAEIAGKSVDDPNMPSGKRFIPDPYVIGPNTTNVLYGKVFEDTDGNTHVSNPSINYRDPVSPDTLIRSSQASYANILAEANQLHYLTTGDAGTSGESRKQARESYIADLDVSAGKLQAAARWALETALAMAAVFAGQPGRFDGLRAYVEAKINSGPVSADEQRITREMMDAELLSRESAMSRIGIQDVDSEMQRITKERQSQQQSESTDLTTVQSVLDSMRNATTANGVEAPAIVAQNGSDAV